MTFQRNKCSYWMSPIFTNKWRPLDMYPMFVWKEGIYIVAKFCTELRALTKWPHFFFLKTEGFTKRPLHFIVLTKWLPIFLLSSLKDPLFSLLCLSPKDPYFGGLVCTSPSLPYVSAPLSSGALALVFPQFDYCSPVWSKCISGFCNALQILRNKLARVLLSPDIYTPILDIWWTPFTGINYVKDGTSNFLSLFSNVLKLLLHLLLPFIKLYFHFFNSLTRY